jgi:hypothetical protein
MLFLPFRVPIQERADLAENSLRMIGATRVPRISIARNIFWCGSVDAPI